MSHRFGNKNGLESCIVPKVRVNVDGFIGSKSKRSPENFLFAFGSYAHGYDFLDMFFGFEVGSFLHGNFTEGIDVHSGVRKVDLFIFDFDLGIWWGLLSEQYNRWLFLSQPKPSSLIINNINFKIINRGISIYSDYMISILNRQMTTIIFFLPFLLVESTSLSFSVVTPALILGFSLSRLLIILCWLPMLLPSMRLSSPLLAPTQSSRSCSLLLGWCPHPSTRFRFLLLLN